MAPDDPRLADYPPLEREKIVAQARSWLGTPFRHQGRTRKGIDCIGFVWAVGGELGVKADIPNNYSTSPAGHLVLAGCERCLVKPEDQKTIKPGQVLILWGFDRDTAQHFAIVGGTPERPSMIHAFSRRKMVVEDGWDLFWAKRFVALYEFPGVQLGDA